MKKFPISAIVLTLNEEEMIANCLKTLSWCQEIIVIDSGSVDQTENIVRKNNAVFISDGSLSFAARRNIGLKKATQPYIIYVDADERITPTLAKEIMVNLETKLAPVLSVKRLNIFFGKIMSAGGWQNDILPRIFDKSAITTWQGDIHESPQFLGQTKILNSPLIHLSHRSVKDGLMKTINWTNSEAKLLFAAGIKKVNPFTIIRKMGMEFVRRYMIKRGYKDGDVGFMEAIIQSINKALIYIQIWELAKKEAIMDSYKNSEKDILSQWQNENIK